MNDENPDTLPTPDDLTGPCPWCGRLSNFANHQGMWILNHNFDGDDYEASALTCMGCRRSVVVVMNEDNEGVMWWPSPGAAGIDDAVDARVASSFVEGMRCLGIQANRAAAVMFRSALSLYVKDKGSEAARGERHLKTALKHMKNDRDLHPSLWDWADHLNQLGNEGAHPEDYDDVTAEEATALGSFVRQLIRIEYEMPAELIRARNLGATKSSSR